MIDIGYFGRSPIFGQLSIKTIRLTALQRRAVLTEMMIKREQIEKKLDALHREGLDWAASETPAGAVPWRV